MAQFGAGPDLAAQCPSVPLPDGWRPWTDVDGPVPEALAQRAQAVAADTSTSLGSTESYPLPGVTALIRVEPHVWARDAQGNLVQGCFKTGIIYLPSETPAVTSAMTTPDNTSKVVGVLTAVSLAVGTVATLATWNRK